MGQMTTNDRGRHIQARLGGRDALTLYNRHKATQGFDVYFYQFI